ncbi:hypothetical protein [Rhizobium sp. CAU 1783]
MTIIFLIIVKFPIIVFFCALLISVALGKIVKENLERGVNFNGIAAVLICVNLALLALASTFSCATSGSFCLPGVDRDDASTQWLAALGFYATLGGFLIVPVSAFVLSTFALGWVYWIVGGRKRYPSAKN